MTRDDYMEIVTPLIKEAWSDGKAGKYRDVWESWATDKAQTGYRRLLVMCLV